MAVQIETLTDEALTSALQEIGLRLHDWHSVRLSDGSKFVWSKVAAPPKGIELLTFAQKACSWLQLSNSYIVIFDDSNVFEPRQRRVVEAIIGSSVAGFEFSGGARLSSDNDLTLSDTLSILIFFSAIFGSHLYVCSEQAPGRLVGVLDSQLYVMSHPLDPQMSEVPSYFTT